MQTITLQVLSWVLPVVLGPVVYFVARYALNASDKIDDLPASVKRIAVIGIGTAISYAFAWLHIDVPSECAALKDVSTDIMVGAVHACAAAINTKAPLQALVAAAVAMVIHEVKKSHPST